jgi:hypothetical protein
MEVLGSNLNRNTEFPEMFLCLSLVPPSKFQDSRSNYAMTSSFHVFP